MFDLFLNDSGPTKILYSGNHNLMRTVGFLTILAAATGLQLWVCAC